MSIVKVQPKSRNIVDEEAEISEKQDIDVKQKESDIKNKDALTLDIRAQTILKIALSVFIILMMIAMFIFQWLSVNNYLESLMQIKKEIPKEVVMAILATSSSMVTLMGFILKGLFKS